MKKRVLPLVFVTFLVAGLGAMLFFMSFEKDNDTAHLNTSPKSFIKAKEHLAMIRNNLATGILDPSYVIKAREQADAVAGYKSGNAVDFNWSSLGPNNIGGRTRALFFDTRDTSFSTIYAAGVNGGIFKTTNLGASWNRLENETAQNLSVSCMMQTSDNKIYVGTGEGFNVQNYTVLENLGYNSGFVGQGIFESSDGETFTLVPGTEPEANNDTIAFAYVNEIARDPNGNLWAATNTGILTQSGGDWSYAQYTDSTGTNDLTGLAWDIKISSTGLVIASVGGKAYVSTGSNANGFTSISTDEEDQLPSEGIGRIEFAIAPSDENVVYALAAADNTKSLENIYLSEDGGATWRIVGPGGSTSLNLLGSFYYSGTTENYYYQGDFCNSITVYPNNPYKILAGGVNLWEGELINQTGYYQWAQRSVGDGDPITQYNQEFCHVDHHLYAFRPNYGNEFAIATDGGVFYGSITNGVYSFESLPINFVTTQYYVIAPSVHYDRIIGGTQDNGTLLSVPFGNQMYGYNIWSQFLEDGGDGGYCEMSSIEKYVLNDGYYAPVSAISSTPMRTDDDLINRMRRSETDGFDFSLNFLDGDIVNDNFLTPMALYENFNNLGSETEVLWMADATYTAGTTITARSNNREQPFNHVLENDVNEGDSIMVKDIVTNNLFIATQDEVWMTMEALDFTVNPEWWLISDKPRVGFEGDPSCIAYSSDGNYLFVGTYDGKLYRISNIAYAQDYNKADVMSPNCVIATDEIAIIQGELNQAITSVSIDPGDANKVLVTLGNYGNSDYIYYTESGLDNAPVFESVQGNLPAMPVYASVLEMDPGNNLALIGTDQGIWVSDDVSAKSWYQSKTGIGIVPVFDLQQQTTYKEEWYITF
ncbi:MAG: hypothetical protein K8R53_00480, partial [Bacteroidales bacterium]|nr:hypothetical protein [Bacteroidales bacterium]